MAISKRWISLGLSLLGVLGVGGTAYVAVRCSKKADEKETVKEKAIAYIPAAIVGVGTGAAILGSQYVSRQEIMALTATCGYLVSNRDKIEAKIKEKFGVEKLSEVRQEVVKEQIKDDDKPWDDKKWNEKRTTVEYTGRGNELFMDWYSGRKFYSNYRDVCAGIKKLNYNFHQGIYVSLNDLYDYWGIEKTQFGEQFGWPANDDYYDYSLEEPIPFDIVHVNAGQEDDMYIIQHRGTPPMECWMEV